MSPRGFTPHPSADAVFVREKICAVMHKSIATEINSILNNIFSYPPPFSACFGFQRFKVSPQTSFDEGDSSDIGHLGPSIALSIIKVLMAGDGLCAVG